MPEPNILHPRPTHLTPKQVADRYGVTERTLARWRVTGDGPAWLRIGARRVLYSLTTCSDWEAKRTFPHRAAEIASCHESNSAKCPGA